MKSIFKKTFASYFFAFAITAILMTVNVNAQVYTEDVKLTAETSETIEVAENAKVTIDLNEQTLNVKNGHGIYVNKGAIVTIKGNGKVLASKAAVANNGGTVTIENGTFYSSTFYAVKNLGKMTIKGGLFTQKYGDNVNDSSLIANGFFGNVGNDLNVTYPTSDPNVSLEIFGGTFENSTTTQTVKGDDWSETIIYDGQFTSVNGYLTQAAGEFTINGGTFTGFKDIAKISSEGSKAIPGKLIINGGKFDANYIAVSYKSGSDKGSLTITGGDFTGIKKGIKDPEAVAKSGLTTALDFSYTVTGGTFSSVCNVQNAITNEYEVLTVNNNSVVEKKGEFTLNKTSYVLEKGKDVQIDFTANDTAKKYFEVTSSDTKVATVSKDGKITGVSAGTATISVGYTGNLKEVTVTVYEIKADEATKTEETTINTVIEKLMSDEKTEVKGIDEETTTKIVEAVKAGKTIETVLEANEVETKDVPKEDVKVIEKVLEKEDKIASYLDVSVLLKVEEDTIGKITELENKVKVSVEVPTTLPEVEKGYTRNYYVIRVHNGETTKLDVEIVDGKLVFETDKFSTYALAYSDVKDEEKTTTEVKPTENPKTTDEGIGYILITLISILGITSGYGLLKESMNK